MMDEVDQVSSMVMGHEKNQMISDKLKMFKDSMTHVFLWQRTEWTEMKSLITLSILLSTIY